MNQYPSYANIVLDLQCVFYNYIPVVIYIVIVLSFAVDDNASTLLLIQIGSVEATALHHHIGSNQSDVMENSILYCGILLAALLGLGLIRELAKYARGDLSVLFILYIQRLLFV